MSEPGKNYHVSDVAGGTDLIWFLNKINQFHPLYHSQEISFTGLPHFSCAMFEKLLGALVLGYKAMVYCS